MKSVGRFLFVASSVIVVFLTFVFNLVTYDCSISEYGQSSVPAHCEVLDSSNVAYIDTWARALNGSVLLLLAFPLAAIRRCRKVAMALLAVGGAQLIIASGFCFKSFYLSINYPGGACCYNISIDSCVMADVMSQCPRDRLSSGTVAFATGEECSVATCRKQYPQRSPATTVGKNCTSDSVCRSNEVCSISAPLKHRCACQPGYGRQAYNSSCTSLSEGRTTEMNKLSGANIFQSLLTLSSTAISIIMFVVLYYTTRNSKPVSVSYSHHTDEAVHRPTSYGTASTDVATGKGEDSHLIVN